MKKFITLTLALMLLLTACGNQAQPQPSSTTSTTAPVTTTQRPTLPELPQQPDETKSARFEVLSCCFKEQVLPTDFESYVGYFPAEEGKVYVDLTMRVRNTGESALGSNDITASFDYDDQHYQMQFELEESAGDFKDTDKSIAPGETGVVHLFYTVDAAAKEESLEVAYTVVDQSDKIQVDDYVAPVLEEKILLNIGDIHTVEGAYTVEVLDCMVSDKLQATGENALKYYVEGYDVFTLVLKVANEGDENLTALEGYYIDGDQIKYATEELEVEENRKLESLSEQNTIKAGEEGIVHLWVAVPIDTEAAGMIMRFNILGESFYCSAVG